MDTISGFSDSLSRRSGAAAAAAVATLRPMAGAALLLTGLGAVADGARGAILMTVTESGGAVVATATGSANLSGVEVVQTTGLAGPGVWGEFGGFMRVGSAADVNTTMILGAAGHAAWVSPALVQLALATTSTPGADLVGVRSAGGQVYLPGGYVSGSPLNAGATWSGATLDSLGLTPGATYTWTWGRGPNTDTLTVHVVPEPAALLPAAVAAAVVYAGGRRRQRMRSVAS